jgi:DUF1680 family protein
VAGRATIAELDGWHQHEYRDVRELGDEPVRARAGELVAIPYFAWANRGEGAMRVWIPRAVN